jgi:hypothetical protein
MNPTLVRRAIIVTESPAFTNAEQALLDVGISFEFVANCALDACPVCAGEVQRRAA